MPVKPVPDGYHTITPYLVVNDAAGAIEFYQKAFGAKEYARMPGPTGKVMHAELKIGDSMLMLSDEMPQSDAKAPSSIGGTSCSVFLYVEDVDALFKQATAAGAKTIMPPMDMFWGDRFGKLTDPFGHSWGMATHKEDLTPEEVDRRGKEAMAQMAKQQK